MSGNIQALQSREEQNRMTVGMKKDNFSENNFITFWTINHIL